MMQFVGEILCYGLKWDTYKIGAMPFSTQCPQCEISNKTSPSGRHSFHLEEIGECAYLYIFLSNSPTPSNINKCFDIFLST